MCRSSRRETRRATWKVQHYVLLMLPSRLTQLSHVSFFFLIIYFHRFHVLLFWAKAVSRPQINWLLLLSTTNLCMSPMIYMYSMSSCLTCLLTDLDHLKTKPKGYFRIAILKIPRVLKNHWYENCPSTATRPALCWQPKAIPSLSFRIDAVNNFWTLFGRENCPTKTRPKQ